MRSDGDADALARVDSLRGRTRLPNVLPVRGRVADENCRFKKYQPYLSEGARGVVNLVRGSGIFHKKKEKFAENLNKVQFFKRNPTKFSKIFLRSSSFYTALIVTAGGNIVKLFGKIATQK